MKIDIFAEDKPAEKVFVYKLEVADHVLLLSTSAQLSRAVKAYEISVVESTQPLRLARQSKDN